MFSGGKRKPSFKMVSNMVIQLLHSIKFSMEVPFSNMTQQPVEMQKTLQTKKVKKKNNFYNVKYFLIFEATQWRYRTGMLFSVLYKQII